MKLPKISLYLVLLTTDYWLLAPLSEDYRSLITDYWLENTRIRKTENQSRTENMAKTHGSQ
jgi:hypothetical protein